MEWAGVSVRASCVASSVGVPSPSHDGDGDAGVMMVMAVCGGVMVEVGGEDEGKHPRGAHAL